VDSHTLTAIKARKFATQKDEQKKTRVWKARRIAAEHLLPHRLQDTDIPVKVLHLAENKFSAQVTGDRLESDLDKNSGC